MSLNKPKSESIEQLKKRDIDLRASLDHCAIRTSRGRFRNPELAQLYARYGSDAQKFDHFEAMLTRKGLFSIRFETHRWSDLDRSNHLHTLARAAVTDMWPMGTSYWLRDNAIIGARFLSSNQKDRQRIGAKLLLSGMSFMSSDTQRNRFESVIRSQSSAYRNDPQSWPYIFADIKGNLSCKNREGWAHKQDAWQILALHLLDAIENGRIPENRISSKHREFLALLVPFLAKVECWKSENSGSWEEIPAVRTSVRAWEHCLIVRLGELSRQSQYRFLEKKYAKMRRYLSPEFKRESFLGAVNILDRRLCSAMLRDLPFESPHYSRRDPRYREGDAALFYLLELNYPQFLASRTGKDDRWAKELEKSIVSSILNLQDRRTGGVYRYARDTYQREGYFSNLTVAKLTEMYGGPSADASTNFTGRERILPKGRKASWTHFVWQLCWWGARQYITTGETRYRALHERLFKTGLSLVTGQRERSLDVGSDGVSRVVRIPPWRMPECYIAERSPRGREMIIPSPHTPLNWATAEMLHAFTLRRELLLGE